MRELSVWRKIAGLSLVAASMLDLRAQPLRTREIADLPDDIAGYQIHVMYVVPADGTDRRLDLDGQLDTSIASFQNWLSDQAGGRQLRMDTFQGNLDITFFRTQRTNSQIAAAGDFVRDVLEAEILAAGFRKSEKLYLLYYDGRSNQSCGAGAGPPALTGSVGALFLQGVPPGALPCGNNRFTSVIAQPGYLEFAMLHEVFHTVGAVPLCAPNYIPGNHVGDDARDLMYAGSQPWRPSILDLNRNDYFGHGRAGCLDVAQSAFLTPAAGQPSLPPPNWPLLDAPVTPCSQLAQVSSSPGAATSAQLQIVNATGARITISWIPSVGAKIEYKRLDPGDGFIQGTFGGHQWVATDSAGNCLAIAAAVAPFRRFIVTSAPARQPTFSSDSVVEAFTGQPGMAPGTWVSLFGANLAAASETWSPATNAPLPVAVGGVSVFVAGRRAPVWFISPTQINFLVPAGTPVGDVPVIVSSGNVESAAIFVRNGATLPALYALPLGGVTPARYYATAISAALDGGRPVYVGSWTADSRVTRGARAGEVIQLFALGLGATTPDLYTDRILSSSLPLRDAAAIRFGGVPGRVLFAGLVGTGLYQINVEIPSSLAIGDVPIHVEAGGIRSRDGVFLVIE